MLTMYFNWEIKSVTQSFNLKKKTHKKLLQLMTKLMEDLCF